MVLAIVCGFVLHHSALTIDDIDIFFNDVIQLSNKLYVLDKKVSVVVSICLTCIIVCLDNHVLCPPPPEDFLKCSYTPSSRHPRNLSNLQGPPTEVTTS